MKRTFLLLLLPALLAGCATTPADRIARAPATFAAWPAAVQVRVRAGEVALGFTPEQVRMALGAPDRILTRATAHGTEETWIYGERRSRMSIGLGLGGGGRSGYVSGGTVIRTGGWHRGSRLRVTFADGRVSVLEQSS
jgi:hypothetical protein